MYFFAFEGFFLPVYHPKFVLIFSLAGDTPYFDIHAGRTPHSLMGKKQKENPPPPEKEPVGPMWIGAVEVSIVRNQETGIK